MTRQLQFHRDFVVPTGGHGKVWDYYQHTLAHPAWTPDIYLTPASIHAENPWRAPGLQVQASWRPDAAEALFLGGMDWQAYPHDHPQRPVINLVQHVRHGDPAHPLYAFLGRRAIRICVGAEVAEAITATGRVNGPVHVIDAALRWGADGMPVAPARAGVFVDAIKQPSLGHALASALLRRGQAVDLCDRRVPREGYLTRMAASRTAVLLPHATEGFYLPGLEAMALGCATVVPDCVGNRTYLAPDVNALVPALEVDDLAAAVARLDDPGLHARLAAAGRATAARFGLARERVAFHALLDDLDRLWAG